jgi:hypothetical protein
MNDVAGIDEAEACLAGEGRTDRRIAQLGLRVVDRGLVTLDLCIKLVDLRLLRVQLLPRGVVLLGESAVALKIELRIFQIGLVLRLFGLRHFERRLKGSRVDPHQQIAFIHHLTLAKSDLDHLTIDAAPDGHGVIWLHDAKTVQIHREIGVLDRLDRDRDWQRSFGPLCAGIGLSAERVKPAEVAEEHDRADNKNALKGARSKRKNAGQKSYSNLCPRYARRPGSINRCSINAFADQNLCSLFKFELLNLKILCAINSEPRDRNGTNTRTSLLFDRVRPPALECRGTECAPPNRRHVRHTFPIL